MTTDPKAAEAFYSKVVGWKTKPFDQDPSYEMLMMGGKAMGGLMAQRVEGGTGPKPQWFNYMGTPDVDATVRQAVELGGRVMRPAWDIPKVGRLAFLTDPQGAPFAVLAPLPMDGGSTDNRALGDFSWHELLSTNWQAAWDFYSKLFGWRKTDSMDMGERGTYQMFGLDGKTFGGMFTKGSTPPGPPFWIAYANVPDARRAGDTIKTLGGTILNGPMDVPGGGTIVTGVDPQGAVFAVFSRPPAVAKPAPSPKRAAAPARKRTAATGKSRTVKRSRPIKAKGKSARAGKARVKSTKRKPARKGASKKKR